MRPVAFSCNEFQSFVTIDVGQHHVVVLRSTLVDSLPFPRSLALVVACLPEPVQPVAVGVAVDDVRQSVLVHIVRENGDTGATQLELGVKRPLVSKRVLRGFQPSVGDHKIATAVAVDITETKSMAATTSFDLVLFKTPCALSFIIP